MGPFIQGDCVKFSIGNLHGIAQVCGKSTTAQPIIGESYILRPEPPLNAPSYPFTHFVCPEIGLELIPKPEEFCS